MSASSNGKWIDADRRLAIYLRDGCACVWCGRDIKNRTRRSLTRFRAEAKQLIARRGTAAAALAAINEEETA